MSQLSCSGVVQPWFDMMIYCNRGDCLGLQGINQKDQPTWTRKKPLNILTKTHGTQCHTFLKHYMEFLLLHRHRWLVDRQRVRSFVPRNPMCHYTTFPDCSASRSRCGGPALHIHGMQVNTADQAIANSVEWHNNKQNVAIEVQHCISDHSSWSDLGGSDDTLVSSY